MMGSQASPHGMVSPRYVRSGTPTPDAGHTTAVFHQCCPGEPKIDSLAQTSGTNTPTVASIAHRPWMISRSRIFMMSRCAPICRGSHPTSPGISPVRCGGTTCGPAMLISAAGKNFLRSCPYRSTAVSPVRRTAEVTTIAALPLDQYAIDPWSPGALRATRAIFNDIVPTSLPATAPAAAPTTVPTTSRDCASPATPPSPPPLPPSSPSRSLPSPSSFDAPWSPDPTAHQSLAWNPGIMPCASALNRSRANELKLGSCGGFLRCVALPWPTPSPLRTPRCRTPAAFKMGYAYASPSLTPAPADAK
mmetsp:Transcript_8987/g.14286  ORF Transcript_8987/g.14286 Transcript_8987/m.14286 type:complete len:305 (-) Transcript_8987:3047-3961(-)